MTETETVDIEIKLLMEGIFQIYGYDFREYAEASLRRRLTKWLTGTGYATLSLAQAHLLRDRKVFDSLLAGITINVSEMFRDPSFFKAIREQVVPHLKTYPFVKIWLTGCATGEEAYSLAILLHEEGLNRRFRIYATDINEKLIHQAQEGIYPLQELQRFTKSYQHSGGKGSFSDYYTARYDHAILSTTLREHIVFANHNLAIDADFGEMNMILCRNVMIYFKPPLKQRVLSLFDSSLIPGGFLCLGIKENKNYRYISDRYNIINQRTQIYQKRYEK